MSMWEKLRPYAMVAPAITVFSLFFIYPILYMIYLSMYDWNFISPTKNFVGLQNFADLLQEKDFIQVITNSTVYTLLTVTLTIGLSRCSPSGLIEAVCSATLSKAPFSVRISFPGCRFP
ncbi:hypothetical protein LJK88_25420 [Paenibacillus sp. P26]|nr:hypothetical protein LJK88_25420 [Paenibacillus sp. P26]